MIELTVKTLDSQNHQFSVEDDITVEQFKAQIAGQVNIPAATQRIIYCGRVLQDEAKLADYDVNGKVVHLVQRAPPSATSRNNRPDTPPPEGANRNRGGGGFMGFDRVGNAVYMGSMALPNNFMETHGLLPPRATHSLSASRLNIARRMLRSAENVIRLLENPTLTPEQASQAEEPQEEEMTPIIEARVIVPNNADQPIDENAVISAVENTIFNVSSDSIDIDRSTNETNDSIGTSVQSNIDSSSSHNSEVSTPEASTPRSSSIENLTSEHTIRRRVPTLPGSRGAASADNSTANASESSQPRRNRRANGTRGSEMADLLTLLNQLQARFAPFLSRYQTFMQEDPEVAQENLQQTRLMLNRVSQVLHYLGHAYHSLSDIMINVDSPPPRLLRCRPILIHQSAVVQAGIPIQVEAQINVSTERPSGTSNQPNNQSAPTAPTENATSATPTPNQNFTPANGNVVGQPNLGFVGLPFMPSGSMRVITTPIEIRAVRANGSRPRPSNNATPTTQTTTQPAPDSTSSPAEPQQQNVPPQPQPQSQQHPFGGNNVEFFMELNPEVLRGGNVNGPPHEFLQSVMQLINAQVTGRMNQQPQTTPDSAPSQTTTGQNSQARVNTQTHPTTATHTMSTTRPHIHMTQQTVQGGFDPFLPCYSHHITSSRNTGVMPQQASSTRQESSTTQSTSSENRSNRAPNPPNRPENPTAAAPQPSLQNIIVRIEDLARGTQNLLELMAANRAADEVIRLFTGPGGARQPEQGEEQETRPPPTGTAGDQAEASAPPPNPLAASLSSLVGSLPDPFSGNSSTLDQLLQMFHQYDFDTQEDSLIMNLVMLLIRNLRFNDLFLINSGDMTPLNRSRRLIQDFFIRDVCQSDTTSQGIERATGRVLNDLRTVVDAFGSVQLNANINLVASIEKLLQHHIPLLINLAINLTTDDVRPLVDQLWTAAKQLLSLVLFHSSDGQQGLQTVLEELMTRSMNDIPVDVRNWTISNSRTVFRTVINSLNVSRSDVEQFIVRTPTSAGQLPQNNPNIEVESMDIDYDIVPNNIVQDQMPVEDMEPLPNVVWGSEPWHRQTPEDWVPIITRDVQKQRRQNSQPPFSDAYLSGMPSKRRKLISNSKPQGSLSEVITESVRQAVTATGLTTVAPLETVATAAGSSAEIQTAYRTLLRSSVQANLRDNEDFTPERFPNASSYFNGTLPE